MREEGRSQVVRTRFSAFWNHGKEAHEECLAARVETQADHFTGAMRLINSFSSLS